APACEELLRAELCEIDAFGSMRATHEAVQAPAPSADAVERLVEALAHPDADGWSWMRAAELSLMTPLASGSIERAEGLAYRALAAAGDMSARDDLWTRWETALDRL